jgi:hypothetical protein
VTDLALLAEGLRRGVRVVWDPPRYRGPAAAMALFKEVPDAARELLRRAAVFREQIESWNSTGRIGVPLLVLPAAPAPRLGACVSCGASIERGWRCPVCLHAVELALGLSPPNDGPAP